MHIHSWPTLGTCRRCHCEDRSLGIACSDLFFFQFLFFFVAVFFFFCTTTSKQQNYRFFCEMIQTAHSRPNPRPPLSLIAKPLRTEEHTIFFARCVFVFTPPWGKRHFEFFFEHHLVGWWLWGGTWPPILHHVEKFVGFMRRLGAAPSSPRILEKRLMAKKKTCVQHFKRFGLLPPAFQSVRACISNMFPLYR